MDLQRYPQTEKIINKFLLKSLHIILDSRVLNNRSSITSVDPKKSDKWFNLVLGDPPVTIESLNFWNRGLMQPMMIDIVITQGSNGAQMLTNTVIERWTVQYESTSPHFGDAVSYKKTYKKSIILLRSVFSMLRLLPAYKAFRKLSSMKQNCDFDISYKVFSFGSLFSTRDEESMKKYIFIPVEAQQGCLSISVVYRKDLSDFNLDSRISCPPEIINEYVGSPLADPMRAFPCTRQYASSSHRRRPHSWSSGLHKDARGQAFSASSPSFQSPYSYMNQNEMLSSIHRAESDDIVSSPLPSLPAYYSGRNPSRSHVNSETAPMSIPHSLTKSPRYISPNFSDPNRSSLPPLSPRNTRFDHSSNDSPSGIKGIRRLHSLRTGESSSGFINAGPKVYPDAREDSGRFISLPSPGSSPRIGLSRSSSRVSFQDDLGECDFSCPFIVDDVDPPDSLLTSFGRNNSRVKKSQDASAVGALVEMLKTASPLRQDSNYHTSLSSNIPRDRGASEFFKPRRTSDALEELQVYKEMKHALLSKSASHLPVKKM